MVLHQNNTKAARGDLVRVHLIDGEFAYDGICTSATRRGLYVVNRGSGHYYRSKAKVRIEVVLGSSRARRVTLAELMNQAQSITWTSLHQQGA